MDVINELERLGADDAVKRFRGHGFGGRQIGHDGGSSTWPHMPHVASIDVPTAELFRIAVIADLEHAPADVRLALLEEPLDEHNIDAALPLSPIKAEHPAD